MATQANGYFDVSRTHIWLVKLLLALVLTSSVVDRAVARAASASTVSRQLSSGSRQRNARFRHGTLQTSRWVDSKPQGARASSLTAAGDDAQQTHAQHKATAVVWVVGLQPTEQQAVRDFLLAHGGDVLRVLPGGADDYHWLVKATQSAITQLLAEQQDVTAALLPSDMKISQSVEATARSATAGSHDTTLKVVLPHASAEELAAAARLARQELPALLGPACKLAVAQNNRMHSLSITVCPQGVQAAAAWAASQDAATWVTAEPRVKVNNLYANAASQAAKKLAEGLAGNEGTVPPAVVEKGAASGYLPFWNEGLTGKDQVVAVFDTGIDTDSCFFYDPHVPELTKVENVTRVEVLVQSSTRNVTIYTSHKHRKVMQLTRISDAVDSNGHGTHVSCTIAGSPYGFNPLTQPSLATGIAPDAKLSFVDVSSDKVAASMDGWSFSNVHQIYDIVRDAGARITSSSLSYSDFDQDGKPLNYAWVDEYCYDWDTYTWARPDMLHMCSAGNDGDRPGLEYVGAPAICKNTMAIAASDGWWFLQNYNLTYDLLSSDGKKLQLPPDWDTWYTDGFVSDTSYFAFDSIADYSSFKSGLTYNGKTDKDPYPRIKPEIAAVGLLLSAATDKKTTGKMDQCRVRMNTGTSMATPVVSGAAAIVRQYFLDGFYPTGAADPSHSADPAGTTVKAVLIAGTAAMKGYSLINKKRLEPPPSPYQGFGRLDLAASLPLASVDPTWKMKAFEYTFKSMNDSGSTTVQVGNNPNGHPLVVVLTWYDWPATENTGGLLLVNDLDLVVQDSKGKTYPVNGKKGRDSANTVEKVYIPNAPAGETFTITVKTASPLFILALPQSFSLVVLGPLAEAPRGGPPPMSPPPSPVSTGQPRGFPPCGCESHVASPYSLAPSKTTTDEKETKICMVLSTHTPDTSSHCGRGKDLNLRKIEFDIDPACQGAVRTVTFDNVETTPVYSRYTVPDGRRVTMKIGKRDSAINLLGTYQQLSKKPVEVCLHIRKSSNCTSLQSLCRSGTCWASFFSPSGKCCPVTSMINSQ